MERNGRGFIRSAEDKELLRGKYLAYRFPMLREFPDIDPGSYWGIGKPHPPGFRLDKSGRIWPVAVKAGRVAPPEKRCKATSHDTGEQCPMFRLRGRNTCRMHGDAESQGITHPKTITGEYSRSGIFGDVMPAELSKWFEANVTNAALNDLSHNIAMLTSRERELLSGLSTGESKANWRTAQKIMGELSKAMREQQAAVKSEDEDAIAKAEAEVGKLFRDLRECVRAGSSDSAAWEELQRIGERKRRLIETERKRRIDLKLVVTADQLRAILRSFTIIVFEEINSIPGLVVALVKRDRELDTGKLSKLLASRIGRRMTKVCQGMKAGKLLTEEA